MQNQIAISNSTLSTRPKSLSAEERFYGVERIIEQIGYRPLARYAELSAGHVHRVLNGKIKSPVLATLRKISKASQISLEDLIFYVERQMEYERKSAGKAA